MQIHFKGWSLTVENFDQLELVLDEWDVFIGGFDIALDLTVY